MNNSNEKTLGEIFLHGSYLAVALVTAGINLAVFVWAIETKKSWAMHLDPLFMMATPAIIGICAAAVCKLIAFIFRKKSALR